MGDFIRLVGANRAVEIAGVKLFGVNADNGWKLLFSLVFLAVRLGLNKGVRRITRWAGGRTAISGRLLDAPGYPPGHGNSPDPARRVDLVR